MYFRPGGRNEKERYAYAYLTVEQFLKVKCEGRNLSQFFKKNDLQKIFIYGTETLAELLYKELKNSSIDVKGFIDEGLKKSPQGFNGLSVFDVNKVDFNDGIVVITSLFDCNKAIDKLLEAGCSLENIINLNDVVYAL